MKLRDAAQSLGLVCVTENDSGDREVTGCYIGDLLSWVMSKAQPGNIWITVQTNINILAVATLTDTACIVIPEDIKVDDMTLKKANVQEISIYQSSKTSYQLAKELSALI